jgi:hypothetical protein
MGDEENGKTEAFLKVLEEVQDLRLDGDVQGRNGLVTDDETRLEGQSPGDPDTLALTTGKLVGILHRRFGAKADDIEEFSDPLAPFPAGLPKVRRKRFGEDVAHPHPGVKGRIGILKDDLHVPPMFAHPAAVKI